MKEKIIILGNSDEWCEKCLTDFTKLDNVKLNNYKYLREVKGLSKFLAKVHFSFKINKIVKLPFKSIWYKDLPKFVDAKEDERIIFIVYDRNVLANNEKFIKFLRDNFKDCKIAYMFTNIISKSGAEENNFVSKLSKNYDVVYAFDQADAVKYNFEYSPLIYSMNKMEVEPKNQTFYVGRAKDRYPMLVKVFEKLKELKVDSKFYIFGVPEEEQKYKDTIKYNTYISYDECLRNIQESNCLIDVIQGNSEGFTIKVCEAVYYDKLLITTNENVKSAPFYDERFICVLKSAEDIPEEFFKNANNVKYSKEGKDYFSVDTYLKKLHSDLKIDN